MLYGASCCAYDDQRITSRTFLKPASPIFLKYSGFMGGSGTVSPLRSNTPGMLMPRPSLRFCSKGSVPGAALVCNGNRAIKVSTMGKRLIQILGKRLCGRCQPGYLCGISMQGARAPALASAGTSGNPGLLAGRATPHRSAGEAPGNGSNGFAQTLSVFFLFLGGLREPVAPVAGARGLLLCGGEGEPGRAEQPPHTPVDPKAGAPAAQHQRLQHRAEHRHCHAHGERPRDASAQKTATTPGTVSQQASAKKKRRRNSSEWSVLSLPGLPLGGGSGGLSQSEGAQARVLSVDRCLFRVPGHRSWPTLDLHYGVRQEEHCRKPRPNRTLATFRYRRFTTVIGNNGAPRRDSASCCNRNLGYNTGACGRPGTTNTWLRLKTARSA